MVTSVKNIFLLLTMGKRKKIYEINNQRLFVYTVHTVQKSETSSLSASFFVFKKTKLITAITLDTRI